MVNPTLQFQLVSTGDRDSENFPAGNQHDNPARPIESVPARFETFQNSDERLPNGHPSAQTKWAGSRGPIAVPTDSKKSFNVCIAPSFIGNMEASPGLG